MHNLETSFFTQVKKYCTRLSISRAYALPLVYMCEQVSFQLVHCCHFCCALLISIVSGNVKLPAVCQSCTWLIVYLSHAMHVGVCELYSLTLLEYQIIYRIVDRSWNWRWRWAKFGKLIVRIGYKSHVPCNDVAIQITLDRQSLAFLFCFCPSIHNPFCFSFLVI